MSDPAGRVRFVLVEPQHGGNVGATARVLKNLGFSRLDLVAPRGDPRDDEARRRAVDAGDVLDRASVHPTLDAALDGCVAALGTSRRRGKQRKPHADVSSVVPGLVALARGGHDVALVFGREAHGLSDEELDRCTHLAFLPASEAYPSFNLSHAAAIAAWEVRRACRDDDAGDRGRSVDPPPAGHADREAFYEHWRSALARIGYLSEDATPSMMRRFRRLFGRAGLTEDDVAVLRGVARQIEWIADRADVPDRADRG